MNKDEDDGVTDAHRRVSALVAERTGGGHHNEGGEGGGGGGGGGVVIFASAVGSRSYNLQREDGASDADYAGVYAADPRAFWGLSRPSPTLVASGGSVDDVQVHEAATFANLLLNGNPAAVELLWAEPDKQGGWWERTAAAVDPDHHGHGEEEEEEVMLGTWSYLRRHRDRFLTRQFVKQCLAFAQGQIKQAEAKPEINGKKVYNAIRLLREAERVLAGGSLRMWWDGEDREAIMAIRRGDVTLQDALVQAKELVQRLDAQKPWPALVEKVDSAWLDSWLLSLRQCQLQRQQQPKVLKDPLSLLLRCCWCSCESVLQLTHTLLSTATESNQKQNSVH